MEQSNRTKNILKFLLGSGLGLFMFMCPMPSSEGAFNTPVSLLTDFLDKAINSNMPWFLIAIVIASAVISVMTCFWVPKIIRDTPWLADIFCTSYGYVATRVVAAIVSVCVFWQTGPTQVINDDVGGQMISLAGTLIALAIALSLVLPFLTDVGIMEFTGIMMKPLIRPLFRVPGRASVDLVASWLASSNTAVLITMTQYRTGYYSMREAATIMTNFSLVSIPFCLVVAQTLNLAQHFLYLYGVVTAIGLFLAVVGARLWPLGTIPDSHMGEKKLMEDDVHPNGILSTAIDGALERASHFTVTGAIKDGVIMAIGIVFDIIPIVIAWGTIGTVLVNETPIFQFLSYPMGWYMDLLGVQEAYAIAPQTVVGFIDMFIPALITKASMPEATRFIVAALSVVQIIYMTEVGSIIVKAKVGLGIWQLFVIFLQRTIIALPLIVLASHFL